MPEENKPDENTPAESAPEAGAQTSPPAGQGGGGNKNWFLRHKVVTILGGVVVLIVAIVALGGGSASFDFSVGGPSADCRYEDKNVCKFLNKLKDIDTVSVELEAGSQGASTKSTVKIQGEDKNQIITSTGGRELNIITIGKTVYVKQPDGSWNKYLDEKGELDTGSNSDWKGDLEKSIDDETSKVTYEKLGKEKCGDLNCYKYKMTDPGDKNTQNTVVYFDDKKFLMRKATGEVDGSKTTITYTYDNVNIQEPSGAKEVNSAAELYGGVGL